MIERYIKKIIYRVLMDDFNRRGPLFEALRDRLFPEVTIHGHIVPPIVPLSKKDIVAR